MTFKGMNKEDEFQNFGFSLLRNQEEHRSMLQENTKATKTT